MPAPLTTPAAGVIVFQTTSGGPIYAINQDSSNLRYLTTGLDPALSPDGQWVAFARWETSQDGALGSLWLINVDGTGERVLMTNVYNPRTPVWSPDGSQIALAFQNGGRPNFERKCSGERPPRDAVDIDVNREGRDDVVYCYTQLPDPHWSLRLVNVATGLHQDLPGDFYSLSPTWNASNSQQLVYNGEAGLVNLDLTTHKTSALTLDINDHSPVFSPDGSRIALNYRQDDHWEIHLLNVGCASLPEGCNNWRVRLTETSYLDWVQQELNGETPYSYNNAAPAWSPDGSQIAFLTDRTGRWEIWVMQADGSNQRTLFPAGVLDGIPLQYNGMDEQVLSWR
jgi:TolB protein